MFSFKQLYLDTASDTINYYEKKSSMTGAHKPAMFISRFGNSLDIKKYEIGQA